MKRELSDGTIVDLTQEEIAAIAAENQAAANRVPQRLSRLQVIEQAIADGVWDVFKAQLQAHPTAWDMFMACDYVSRTHPLVGAMGSTMGKDDAGMDQFFRDATKR
jgi:hypothetical protein